MRRIRRAVDVSMFTPQKGCRDETLAFASEFKNHHVPALDYSRVKCLVTVTLMIAFQSRTWGAIFTEQFKLMFPRKEFHQTVTPVFTLNISDIENLLGYLTEFEISDILESFHSKNRASLTSLSSSEVPLLKCAVAGPNVVRLLKL
jgi:hypothetical protein